ncbi:hypothetical protein TNIN_497571 [Trichonephila inaurata madagascariensis]|uniref:Uncharacterized protein n=1 Tax=Trichonephila inaurata madagascariensis TaxID=2747483 RepID=A0A8X6IR99_9ARAC|nr:hypothetical protein TNIN_497571 [Trichonephila inaurata madagascariensis]
MNCFRTIGSEIVRTHEWRTFPKESIPFDENGSSPTRIRRKGGIIDEGGISPPPLTSPGMDYRLRTNRLVPFYPLRVGRGGG